MRKKLTYGIVLALVAMAFTAVPMNVSADCWNDYPSAVVFPPEADAGPELTVNEGDTVTLDGTGSNGETSFSPTINSHIVGQWKMDEGSGTTIYDETDNNNDGTITGASWVDGKFDKALQFGGATKYVQIPNSDTLESPHVTVEAWVKSANPGGNFRYLISKGARNCNFASYSLYTSNAGLPSGQIGLAFYISNDITYKESPNAGPGVWDNKWHHVVGTYDGATIRLFVDGFEVGSGSSTTMGIYYGYSPSDDLFFGKFGGTCTLPYTGLVDEVTIWDIALPAYDIQQHYLCSETGPIALWHMDENSGTTAFDSTDNDNDGTTSGADWSSGIQGNALEYDNVNDYMSVPSKPIQYGMSQLTIETWVYPTTQDWQIILAKWYNGHMENKASYALEIYQKKIYALIKTDGNRYVEVWNKGSEIVPNQWHQIGLVWDGTISPGVMKIYLDGVLQYTQYHTRLTGVIDDTPTLPIYIGAWQTSTAYTFDGKIDEVAIYDRALSEMEIDMHYESAIIDPIAKWPMNEGTGSTTDDSTPNNHDGTITGATWTTSGKYLNALVFDGSNDFVEVADHTDLRFGLGDTITISAWIKPTASPYYGVFLQKGGITDNNANYVFRQNHLKLDFFYMDTSNSWQGVRTNSDVLTLNTWNFVAVTYTFGLPTSIHILVDGDNKPVTWTWGSGTTAPQQNAQTLRMGGINHWNQKFKGTIDDITIWDEAVEPQTIQEMYYSDPAAYGSLGLWHMNEGTGGITYDQTPHDNDGTITGATWTTSGKFDNALHFDGSGDYVEVDDEPMLRLDYSKSISIEAWIKPTTSTETWRVFIQKGGITSNNANYAFRQFGQHLEFFYMGTNNAWQGVQTSDHVLTINDWNYVVVTYNFGSPSSMHLYVNGDDKTLYWPWGDGTLAPRTSDQPIRFGGMNTWNQPFIGYIDEVHILDRELTATEVMNHYTSASELTSEVTGHQLDIVSYQWNFGDSTPDYIETASSFPDGAFDGVTTHTYTNDGEYTVTLTITDEDSNTDTDTTTITVLNVAPSISNIPDATIIEGDTFSYTSGSFTDPGADTWSATVNYGEGDTIPLILTVKTFSLSHTYADDGTYTVTVSIADDDETSTETFEVEVLNKAPAVTVGADSAIDEGHLFTSSGSFTDPGDDMWTATVNYGDGGGVETLLLSGKSFSLSHTYADDGTYIVTVTVLDGDGGSGSASLTVTVRNVAPTVTITPVAAINEGDTMTTSGSFTDPGADIWTATVDYAEGAGPVALPLTSGKTFSLSNLYDDNGDYDIIVSVNDGDAGGIGTSTIPVTVNNVAPVVNPFPSLPIPEGGTFSNLGTFTDPGADTWTATVDYDDGGGVEPLPLTGKTFSLNHLYNQDGMYTITVTVTDDDGDIGSRIFNLNVYNVLPLIATISDATVDEGSTFSYTGSFSDPGADTWTGTVDYDDGSAPETLSITAKTFSLSHVYEDNGVFTVLVTIEDDDGEATATFTITVNNVAPVVDSLTVPIIPIKIKDPVVISGTFSDPGIGDTHTATITWAPGIETAGLVSGNTVTGSHPYSSAGVYTITLTVTDDDGGSGSMTSQQYVVVYEPSGGFVTGGGWIDSPAGAYVPDTTLSGKASFGFVSKYKKGATTPEGNTQFQFKAGDMDFQSDTYQWLVIGGPKAQFKGTGTINDEGNYGFLLTAVDGAINGGGGNDKFRIKIWKISTDNIIYDNQVGAEDLTDPTTTLGGGSIVIHKGK